MKKISIIAALIAMLFTACQHQAQNMPINTRAQLIDKLKQACSDSTIMFGHQDDLNYGRTWWLDPGRSDVKEVCGAYPYVAGFELGGIEVGDSKSLDSVPFDTIRVRMREQYKRGGIVEVSWHLHNPSNGGSAWDASNDTVIQDILDPENPVHHKFQMWLNKLSTFLLSVKNDRGELIPMIFRPWHENSGFWFWWGAKYASPDQYKALWNMTKKYLDAKGLHNLVYAYSPNLGVTEENYMAYYPGNDNVDLLGIDIYQASKTDSLGNIIDYGDSAYISETKSYLTMLTKIGQETGKPIAFTETGFETIPQTDWWTNVLWPTIKDYPIAYVLVWRNVSDEHKKHHFFAPFPGQVSAPDFVKFYDMDKGGFIK